MKNNISHAAGLILAFAVILCFIFTSTVLTAFEASASAPSITLEKESVGMGEEIVVRYNGTGGKDWIGIYPDGEVPGPKPSLRWCYAQNGSGTVSLIAQSAVDANKFLPAGKYQIYLLQNDGYTVLDRKELTVTYNANDYLPSISFGRRPDGSSYAGEKIRCQCKLRAVFGNGVGEASGLFEPGYRNAEK